MLSFTEENYLKGLFHLVAEIPGKGEAGTNELAVHLNVKPATANDMLKKLKEKKLISYEKYGKISLTTKGKKLAIGVLRKHRLWETFLYEKLDFTWDEVHEIAEQLEHIQSAKLVEKLDQYLGFPQYDPHGDVIPNAKGELKELPTRKLSDIKIGKSCRMVAVKDNSAPFLKYVVQLGLRIGSRIKVVSRQEYDAMMEIEVSGNVSAVSQKLADNIHVM